MKTFDLVFLVCVSAVLHAACAPLRDPFVFGSGEKSAVSGPLVRGVIEINNEYRCIFETENGIETVSHGQEVDGYRIEHIDMTEVMVEKEGKKERLVVE